MGAMLEARFQIFLILLAVLAGTALLARRFNIAPAILLMVLPPLIYSASVAMSWREFRLNLRPIILLAVGCVIFTAAVVAAATHYLIGLPWNVGFLLGAIISARRGRAAGDRAPALHSPTRPGRARGRRPRQ